MRLGGSGGLGHLPTALAVLVEPVGGAAVLRVVVHLDRAHLQPYVAEAATVGSGGCNRMWWRLQPYVVEAATVGAHLDLGVEAEGAIDHLVEGQGRVLGLRLRLGLALQLRLGLTLQLGLGLALQLGLGLALQLGLGLGLGWG